MFLSLYPALGLDHASLEQIRVNALKSEKARDLDEKQLEEIYRKKLFKMFVPKSYGGLGLTLPEILRMEELLSWADASTAWVITLCGGAAWFIGFLQAHVADEFFKDDRLCIAGSGAPTGVAEITEGGYMLDGYWKYASGSLHATAFTANCFINKDRQQVFNSDGSPKISSFILKSDEVSIQRTWNAMGMIATGSHSFEVRQLHVSSERCFTIDPKHVVLKDPIYRYPFLQLAETTLAVNISGMSVRFIDLAKNMITHRETPESSDHISLTLIEDASNSLSKLREELFNKVDESWDALTAHNGVADNFLSDISIASRNLVEGSRACVNKLYPRCGLRAADMDTEINRVWRNLHTAAQHAVFSNQ